MLKDKVLYEELRPREFIEKINESPIAYLPLGTLEWHGLQLPYGSDGLQAQGVFRKIAEQAGMIAGITKKLKPILRFLFPNLPTTGIHLLAIVNIVFLSVSFLCYLMVYLGKRPGLDTAFQK